MSDIVIKAEGLGKKYLIGHQQERERYTALRDVIARNLRGTARKARQVLSGQQLIQGDSVEAFWALRDIDFEIKQGDRVGIIGRNGAGKSTLLKILSRITEPSTGKVTIQGRVASLLEVGTGFHPELTGRENIFLNGAILGMSRAEIKKKFDEIIAFAEVEKFLDTPVKRYSSGMYVRLAFAVAAHLEPEILIVDEVLAVGDAQFQKKCLGKMEDVSKNEGRTVLFVSHNMGVIAQLCQKAILLNKGIVAYIGNSDTAVHTYLSINMKREGYINLNDDKEFYIKNAELLDKNNEPCNSFMTSDKIVLRFTVCKNITNSFIKLSCTIQSKIGDYLTTFVEDLENWFDSTTSSKEFRVVYPANLLTPNFYAFRLAIFTSNGQVYDLIEMICPFSITDVGSEMAVFEGIDYGHFFTNYQITVS